MTTVESWKGAFKEIYGKTPTKADYDVAPANLKKELLAQCPKSPARKRKGDKLEPKPVGVRVKRAAPENWSPVKRPFKRIALAEDSENRVQSPAVPAAAKPLTSRLPKVPSPLKKVTFSPSRIIRPIAPPPQKSPSRVSLPRSPLKRLAATTNSPFRSLFDTPEKGQDSPLAAITSSSKPKPKPKDEFESPKKPVKRDIVLKNSACLLLPTPEKRVKVEEEEELEPFQVEDVPVPKTKKPAGKYAKVFNPVTGKYVIRQFKTQDPSTPGTSAPVKKSTKPRKADTNFVRINMKKKSFVRGKVSAEQKRKMRRKANWKKRFAK